MGEAGRRVLDRRGRQAAGNSDKICREPVLPAAQAGP